MGAAGSSKSVSLRQLCLAMVATACCLAAFVVVVRADGLPAVDASSSDATRWFVHAPTGRAVLIDGFGGRALASIDSVATGDDLFVAEGDGTAYLLNDTTGEARPIDSAELRLGPARGVGTLGGGTAQATAGSTGLLIANIDSGEATLLTDDSDTNDISFRTDRRSGAETRSMIALAPDGAVWSLVAGSLQRSAATEITEEDLGLTDDAGQLALSLVGNRPLVLDRAEQRVRLGSGNWIDVPTTNEGSELVVQEPGPEHECGWVGADDDLWCVGRNGVVEQATIGDLDIDGSDLLAIAGDAAALIRRGPTQVVHFDWRNEQVFEVQPVSVSSDAALRVSATVDVIWIDDAEGDFVWTVHPWGIQEVDKNDASLLVLGDEGDVIEDGDAAGGGATGVDDNIAAQSDTLEPDDNGVDDPPVAVDDQASVRAGNPVPIAVTANDYDPDGEAVAVVAVQSPAHGTVEIGTATTVVYVPDAGYVGIDQFEYTITDGNGTEATATVSVELLSPDSNNNAPQGAPDFAETGSGVPVVVEVLLNDVDPERDSLAIDTFLEPDSGGDVALVVGATGLPALRYTPADGFEGTATFSYRPVDELEAAGDDVDVKVEVANIGEANRPPVVRPDAVRTRRNSETTLPVMLNDKDPDGDVLTLSVVEPLPDGLEVIAQGEQLGVTVRAGSADRLPFFYEVDDGNGNIVRGAVLVVVIGDDEQNRPPVVTPDTKTAVVGQTILIDVTANDSDPDGDPLAVIDVTQPSGRGAAALAGRGQVEFTPTAIDGDAANARFTYTVSDGNGHEVIGDITVTVLAQALPEPPYAQDDSTFTFVDEPVTIDVLRNDGDPSGERPTIVGQPGCPSGGVATVTADSRVRYEPPPGQSGAFRCTYEVTNSQNLRDDASIIISVREPEITNEAPRPAVDRMTVEVGESQSIDVTGNDIDPDGDDTALRVTASTQPVIGSVARDGNVFTYTAGTSTGVATIEYQVEDADGAIATGRLQVTVIELQNQAPVARPDTRTIPGPGVATTIALLDNDSDPDDTPGGLTVTSAELTSAGASLSQSAGAVTITPNPDFVGTITGTYTIRDGDDLTGSSTFSLVVLEPINRPPVAGDDNASVTNGGSVTTSVLFNDTDPDGDTLTMSIMAASSTSLGSARVSGPGSISFTANPGESGTATIEYQVSDGEFTDTATLRVSVRDCAQSTPVARSAFVETGYQQPISIDLSSYAENGSVVDVNSPSGYRGGIYTPPAGTNGNVSITYAVVNDCRQRTTGEITIDVNQDPIGQDQSVSLGRDETREIPVGGLASDDESLALTGGSDAPGWVSVSADRVLIAPDQDVADGTYSWAVTVTDPGGLSTAVRITVTVTNVGPTAEPDRIDLRGGGSTTVDLVANDSDPDGPNSGLRIQTVPSSVTFENGEIGSVELASDGRSVRVSAQDGAGTATFQYSIVDSSGAVSNSASVAVQGPAVNLPPTANDQAVSVTVGEVVSITLNASDPDGESLTVDITSSDRGLTISRISGMNVEVRADQAGTLSFTYRVRDADGLESETAEVTITATAAPPTTVPPTTVPPTTVPPTTVPPTTVPPTTVPPTTVPPTTVPPTTAPPTTAPPTTAPPTTAPPPTAPPTTAPPTTAPPTTVL